MEVTPPWAGLGREAALAWQAWQALPDNPLWILQQRIEGNRGPRLTRSRNVSLVIWGCVLALFYGLMFAALVATTQNWPTGEELWQLFVYGVACPVAGVFLLYATAQLALQAQAWLGRERGDARNVQAAMLDPLLGLTLISPRDVVIASLRSLAPLLLAAAAIGATGATVLILTFRIQDGDFGLALLLAPLTLAGYFVASVLGGVLIVLLSVCLGLNSGSAGQRTALVFALLLHQLCGLAFSFAQFALLDVSRGDMWITMASPLAAHLYILLAGLSGVWFVLTQRRAGTGWLLAMPVSWVFGFWVLIGFGAIYSAAYGVNLDSGPLGELIAALALAMLSAWGALNLFSPTSLVTLYSLGDGGDALSVLLVTAYYLLRIALLLGLGSAAYRAALYCAGLRLHAAES